MTQTASINETDHQSCDQDNKRPQNRYNLHYRHRHLPLQHNHKHRILSNATTRTDPFIDYKPYRNPNPIQGQYITSMIQREAIAAKSKSDDGLIPLVSSSLHKFRRIENKSKCENAMRKSARPLHFKRQNYSTKAKDFIIEFLEGSSIHGFIYLAKIGLHTVER